MGFLTFHTKKGNKEANTQGSSESEKKLRNYYYEEWKNYTTGFKETEDDE